MRLPCGKMVLCVRLALPPYRLTDRREIQSPGAKFLPLPPLALAIWDWLDLQEKMADVVCG